MKSDPKPATGLRIEEVRERLQGAQGPAYWRSLEELAGTDEFAELLHKEFPQMLPLEGAGTSRRRFLQLMGASLALAGLNACSIQPEERILPYTKQPEEIVPGKPLYYATAHPVGGFGRGLLVESHMGRPTKIEGNPDHPSSLGSSDLFDQASVLDLYDPDRAQIPQYLNTVRSWEKFTAEMENQLQAQRSLRGEGLRILMGNTTSPTTIDQLQRLRETYPLARVHFYDAADADEARTGARRAFGQPTHVYFDVAAADVLLTLDHDLLTEGPGAVRYARDFADGRRVVEDDHHMNRLYAVESSPTNTGNLADHRLSLSPARLERLVLALASRLGVPGTSASAEGDVARWVEALAADLQSHRGRCLITAGDHLPADLHVLVHAMNERLGNLGRTVRLTEPVMASEEGAGEGLAELAADLNAGKVDVLFLIGGNPVYDAPADLEFGEALLKADLRVRVSTHEDETAAYCQWRLPMSHYLEAWSDVRSHDGTATIVQPLVAPLYDTRSTHEVLELLLGDVEARGHDLVRASWQQRVAAGNGNFEKQWRRWLHDGLVTGAAAASVSRSVDSAAVREAAGGLGRGDGLSLVFRPDPTVRDGAFANNAWLQECPKPHSRITWDNAALMSPRTAESLGVSSEELIRIDAGDRGLEVAAWILPTHADDTITLHLGYGRVRAGKIGNGCGFDTYKLRTTERRWRADDVTVEALGRRYRLASTQLHHNMEGRELVRHTTLDDLHHADGHGEGHGDGHHGIDPNASLMPGFEYDGYKWGMVVDLSSCTGCNACVVACHSENNIAVVGKDEVLNGRELHWMRIDRYFGGDLDQPTTYLQPVMCQHCEQAPCEVVCPVSATVHTDEGLNTMAYNRCVGTRYCGNNCPYKVRRFNFYQYVDQKTESLKLGRNPDVTVRHRGVMEKCSYCIQRINGAKIEATVKELPLSELGLQSACQQACPTNAISFGDLNDEQSQVARWRDSELNYGILTELGTRPRTTYLKRVSNPNPSLTRS